MTISFSKFSALVVFILLALTNSSFAAGTINQPRLYEDSEYNEYWEQQFLFDNGIMVTSQYLIANFPFSSHHGLMVATFKKPDSDAVIIKNGRKRSGWAYDTTEPQLSIYQHKLSGAYPNYRASLDNTAAEVDVTFTAHQKPISLIAENSPIGLPEISLYVPTAEAQGKWRPGPEIGGAGYEGDWENLGAGAGYGIHLIHRTSLNNSIRRWQRFTAIKSLDTYQPILHAFETPNGDKQSVLLIVDKTGNTIRFDDINLAYDETNSNWTVSARTELFTLSGTLTKSKHIEDFALQDHLNHLEKIVAGALADITRHRFSATYELALTEGNKKTTLVGTVLAEDIILGEIKKKKRRSRR